MPIHSLKVYQRRRRDSPDGFADLPDGQRVLAEQWLQRFVAQRRAQGKPLEPWVLALYHGQARRLARNPPTRGWAKQLRSRRPVRRPAAQSASALPPAAMTIHRVTGPVFTERPQATPLRPPLWKEPQPLQASLRLDVRGVTRSGPDGAATAQAILRDLANQAFGQSPLFSEATVAKDLPRSWAWHLEIVPVP
jgi:hypothetical protein